MKLKDYVTLHGGIEEFRWFEMIDFNGEYQSETGKGLSREFLFDHYKDQELIKVEFDTDPTYGRDMYIYFTFND